MSPPDLSVSEPLSVGLLDQRSHAFGVADLGSGASEVVLCDIPVQVLDAEVVMRAVETSLQLREEGFDRIGTPGWRSESGPWA